MLGVNTKEINNTAYASQPVKTGTEDYGKTVGEPKLSEKAAKYYDQLKKKFGNYDFILVSSAEKENAKAHASQYANSFKTVVLIDEEKIEKMASDEKYRKKYENILSGAQAQLDKLQSSMSASGANVKGYGMQVNDNGTVSFFAVLKKSSADQKARIEQKNEQKRLEKRAEAKKAAKEKQEERIKGHGNEHGKRISEDEDETVISANSIEELMQKIGDFVLTNKSNEVQTESEKYVGQNIDYRG